MNQSKNRSNTSTIIAGLVVVGVLGLGALLYYSQPDSKKITNPSGDTSQTLDYPLEITSKDWQRGGFNHKVKLVEYADFQCPACSAYYPLIKQLEKDFPDELLIVFRQFPLVNIHQNALGAARASEAAGRQGKFFEMHDILYEKQKDWSENNDALNNFFKVYAQELGLDTEKFVKDYNDPTIDDNIKTSLQTVAQLGLNSTPTFFVNGRKIANPMSYEEFRGVIQSAIDLGIQETKSETPISTETQSSSQQNGTEQTQESQEKEFHAHADFKVYLKGKPVDFSQEKYQSTEGKELDEYTHLHDGNGNVIHLHKDGLTLRYFFDSLRITFQKDCFKFIPRKGLGACTEPNLKLYVNGKLNDQFGDYKFKDLDRILITESTNEKEISEELKSITDDACMYSEKCPERGKPPTEKCVGGLGSGCKV